jgi:hypothetical protein
LTTRWHRTLATPKVIVAHLFTMEYGTGDPTLITLGELGGLTVVEGIGGRFRGRGFPRRRFVGSSKLYTSLELRAEPFDWEIRGRPISPGLKGFMDAGGAFEVDRRAWPNFHVSGGVGLYVVWNEFLVLRVDAGFSNEGYGIYLNTGHNF